MDKIAGPYLHTLTSIMGDKRSTMLESELQYTVGNLVSLNCCGHTSVSQILTFRRSMTCQLSSTKVDASSSLEVDRVRCKRASAVG